VRLALGRIEAKSGDAKAVREALERVAADAEARGYRLIAREARSAPR
jgi:hypothetical protein